MCGIIGIIAKGAVAAGLLEGLRRLEYRGYDSAGIATLVDGRIERRRAEGKLRNLARRLDREPVQGAIGIGHTRWATHGLPTESNAHPIATERVAVVHNGIIENFQALRAELEGLGHAFQTETDTEAVAILATHWLEPAGEVAELALGPAALDPAVDQGRDPGRIIAAVFEPTQPLDQPRCDPFLADDADDAAHQPRPRCRARISAARPGFST